MSHDNLSPDPLILDRYLTGEASDEERHTVEAWLARYPEERKVLGALVAGAATVYGTVPAFDRDARTATIVDVSVRARRPHVLTGRATIHGRLRRSQAHASTVLALRTLFGRHLTQFVGATCAAVAIVGAIWYAAHVPVSSHTDHTLREYTTRAGQQATVILTDGSRVRLAPRTTLRIANEFDVTARTVSLRGEAYFDVSRTSGTPFIVQTQHATTRVLGTTFDVRDDMHDQSTHVAVVTGKVTVWRMRHDRAPITLTQGMTATVGDSVAAVTAGDATHDVSWLDGQLVFHNASTLTVLTALTRWYGYEFRLNDSTLAQLRLTLGLSTTSSQAALSTLKRVMDVELTVDHGVIMLTPHKAGPMSRMRKDMLTPAHDGVVPFTEVGR